MLCFFFPPALWRSLCFWRNGFYRGKCRQALSGAQSSSDSQGIQSRSASGSALGARGLPQRLRRWQNKRAPASKGARHSACGMEVFGSRRWTVPSRCAACWALVSAGGREPSADASPAARGQRLAQAGGRPWPSRL